MTISDEEWERRHLRKIQDALEREIREKQEARLQKAIERNGLVDVFQSRTFDTFQASEDWQTVAKTRCQKYASHPDGWLLMSGSSGCGKTHLCSAVVQVLMHEHRIPVKYMLYRDEIETMKSRESMETGGRLRTMETLKRTDTLYIDDLFKGGVSDADIRIVFEILDYRYRANKRTIVSTELSVDALKQVDEAIAGRILERSSAKVLIMDKPGRNYRLAEG